MSGATSRISTGLGANDRDGDGERATEKGGVTDPRVIGADVGPGRSIPRPARPAMTSSTAAAHANNTNVARRRPTGIASRPGRGAVTNSLGSTPMDLRIRPHEQAPTAATIGRPGA